MSVVNPQTAIWQNVVDHLKTTISDVEFETWFARIKPIGLKAGNLQLSVPSSFAGDWINKHYKPTIEDALTQMGAQTPKFELVVESSSPVQDDIFNVKVKEIRPQPVTQLNPKYSFENFVVGQNNRLAHAAAMAVAEAPGKRYNPLFIYGGVGLGKTHIMHAVGHTVAAQFPEKRIQYITTEAFTNDLIQAIRTDKMSDFRDRYRSVDLLLVDDIQFVAGKERTQEEFFHTFNTLYESQKQIILSSDRPPKDIATLSERLRSRFEWGLITDITPPELETRMAILEMNSEYRNMRIPEDVVEYIAKQVTSNIRELEGALMRVVAYASLNGVPLTKAVAIKSLADVFSNSSKVVNPSEILRIVANYFSLKTEDLKGAGRRKEVVIPRQIAMYLIRDLTASSLPEIGQFFDGRDHTTILYGIQKIQEALETNPSIQQNVKDIREKLES